MEALAWDTSELLSLGSRDLCKLLADERYFHRLSNAEMLFVQPMLTLLGKRLGSSPFVGYLWKSSLWTLEDWEVTEIKFSIVGGGELCNFS
jgi:hypothetical protein